MLNKKGFSLLELVIAVGALMVVLVVIAPSFFSLVKRPQLDNGTEEVIAIIRLAQNKTLSSEGNSQYGVYFKTSVSPNQYILFKGSSYALRDTAFDQTYSVQSNTEFYAVDTGGANEIVFDKLTGTTANSGNVSLRLKDTTSQTKVIYIDNSGVTGFTALSVPSDASRAKDSRHVDFDYSRTIATATENLILTFNGNVVQTIPINQYLATGQFDWQGTFNITGTNQTMRIHTLRLNAPDTRFSIIRDMRYNDKSVTIKLSADNTGTLAEYSADGLTTHFYSIYVSNFAWQ